MFFHSRDQGDSTFFPQQCLAKGNEELWHRQSPLGLNISFLTFLVTFLSINDICSRSNASTSMQYILILSVLCTLYPGEC
ncbi:hypothetical protein FKM82_010586 [Ascaphus truei]